MTDGYDDLRTEREAQASRYRAFVLWLKAHHPHDPKPTFAEWLDASGENDEDEDA